MVFLNDYSRFVSVLFASFLGKLGTFDICMTMVANQDTISLICSTRLEIIIMYSLVIVITYIIIKIHIYLPQLLNERVLRYLTLKTFLTLVVSLVVNRSENLLSYNGITKIPKIVNNINQSHG